MVIAVIHMIKETRFEHGNNMSAFSDRFLQLQEGEVNWARFVAEIADQMIETPILMKRRLPLM